MKMHGWWAAIDDRVSVSNFLLRACRDDYADEEGEEKLIKFIKTIMKHLATDVRKEINFYSGNWRTIKTRCGAVRDHVHVNR